MNILKVYYGMYGVEIIIEIDKKEIFNENIKNYLGIGMIMKKNLKVNGKLIIEFVGDLFWV